MQEREMNEGKVLQGLPPSVVEMLHAQPCSDFRKLEFVDSPAHSVAHEPPPEEELAKLLLLV